MRCRSPGRADNPVCISGGACVPYNIFTEGGVTEDQLNYLYTPGTAYGTVTQQIVHADVTGDLGEYGLTMPWRETGISVNVGLERRTEDLTFEPDAAELSGTAGRVLRRVGSDRRRLHGERRRSRRFRVPLVQERTGVYDLVFDAGYRYSDYSTVGGADTWKVGAAVRADPGSAVPQLVPARDPRAEHHRALQPAELRAAELPGRRSVRAAQRPAGDGYARGVHADRRDARAVRRRPRDQYHPAVRVEPVRPGHRRQSRISIRSRRTPTRSE